MFFFLNAFSVHPPINFLSHQLIRIVIKDKVITFIDNLFFDVNPSKFDMQLHVVPIMLELLFFLPSLNLFIL